MDLYLPVQTLRIITEVVSANSVDAEVYSIQHYVIKFVSDLRQAGGFLWEVALNTINQTNLNND
jgi:hypothetical protein